MSDENDKGKRSGFLLRVLLENIGGFLALIGVFFAAGKVVGKIETVTDTLAHVVIQQDAQGVSLSEIKTDVAVLKTKVSAIEAKPAGK